MALETLKGITDIEGIKLMSNSERPVRDDGHSIDWNAFDEMRKTIPVCVDHKTNTLSFKIQNGLIKENGINGCQVTDILKVCKTIYIGLNKKFPCRETRETVTKLEDAILWQEERTRNRTKRGVEGTNNA